ncbi:MAG: amidohydrolase family protein, partial [Dissulfurimicrobium sp.]|uniref:amidohydrolase family protein n=1 Tax=Dissulfurimicrobium sp. TaxID=2022436 RepID=UPI003D1385D4
HCPESNLKLASGVAPIAEMIQEGVIVALGTDGAASNNDLDLMSEMDTAAKLQKGIMKDPTFVPASQALAMATTWAAKALHREDLGVLRKGAQADLVVVDLNQVHLRPCYNPVSHIVYVARSGDVQDVIASGMVLMEDRRLTTIDEEDLLSRLKRIVQAI